MENHPIPQDITNFQFKLIGDMTIKQFAYLASGSIFAWIMFSLPISYFLKLPAASIFVFFGISFAFLTLAGRPMDIMIVNFLRATFSPTKYIYQPALQEFQISNTKFQMPEEQINFAPGALKVQKEPEQNELDKKEFDFFHMLTQMLHPVHVQSTPVRQGPSASSEASVPYIVSARVKGEKPASTEAKRSSQDTQKEEEKVQKIEEQTENLEEELKVAVLQEKANEGSANYEDAHKKVLEIEKLLNETLASKQSLEKEIASLKKKLAQSQKDVYTPSATPPLTTPNVRAIGSVAQAKTAGLPIVPEFPNIIVGIIKDSRGNPIGNILVEVKDLEGNPVRAFKTNPLGQFQASTPLVNGTYTIEFEDPKEMNKFDIVKFEAKGDIIPPLEVISIDTREELRKSLFTN